MKSVNFTRFKMWLEDRWFWFKNIWKKPSPYKFAVTITAASLLIVIGTYGVWQLQRLISPDTGLKTTANGRARLQTAIQKEDGSALPTDLSAATPNYNFGSTDSIITITRDGGNYNLTRIQGVVTYDN